MNKGKKDWVMVNGTFRNRLAEMAQRSIKHVFRESLEYPHVSGQGPNPAIRFTNNHCLSSFGALCARTI